MTDTEPVTPARAQPVLVTLPAEIDMATAVAAGEQLAAAFAAIETRGAEHFDSRRVIKSSPSRRRTLPPLRSTSRRPVSLG